MATSEFQSLSANRLMLRDSIAQRTALAARQSPDFNDVTNGEKRRLDEIEARMEELDAAAFAALSEKNL